MYFIKSRFLTFDFTWSVNPSNNKFPFCIWISPKDWYGLVFSQKKPVLRFSCRLWYFSFHSLSVASIWDMKFSLLRADALIGSYRKTLKKQTFENVIITQIYLIVLFIGVY